MPLTISDFLSRVDVERIEKTLHYEFEAASYIKRFQGRKTVVFNLKDTPFPVVANMFDERRKVLLACSTSSEREVYQALTSNPLPPKEAFEWRDFEEYYERRSLSALQLGAIRYYEKDAGRYLTSSIVVAASGEVYNASVHRMLALDSRRMAVRIVPRHLYKLLAEARRQGRELPVTVLLGAHPLVLLASSASPPFGSFELGLLPYLLGRRVEAARSPLHGNPVPIGTSVVVEARITLEDAPEGPFTDLLCTYDDQRPQPVLEIDEVWVYTEDTPYLHAILPGGLEHAIMMGLPKEAGIWSSVSRVVPEVVKVRLTPASGSWLHAVVSIKKAHDGDGKNAIVAAFAGHPSLKLVVVVDNDIDADRMDLVEWAIATRFQPDRGLVVLSGARGSTLDPSARDGLTSKIGIDATAPIDRRDRFERARIPGED
uniref:Anhydromevalonate phosphate decarboxylase n=1 Tax=Fervidicoccus fontis TaxID=683846 RepID=A0A7J3ZK77_9CREN